MVTKLVTTRHRRLSNLLSMRVCGIGSVFKSLLIRKRRRSNGPSFFTEKDGLPRTSPHGKERVSVLSVNRRRRFTRELFKSIRVFQLQIVFPSCIMMTNA